ncbi:glycoside hydrolase family 3 C-terminal domain-containing protein [Conexibacter stalactiti]|uniref:Glycoside hydrolase family 3 C-terminal domain-containing protein n=1 Tax=Conexibacter stalactiti TaxID=1940611 RepID=A0ABU4HV02_9ACTN|nr:glycoside hydrolase family 3 C-terminal domain-containing protein [Conexibacter stalactiti]MDW5597128.1 glycoside hydrolase family 3 C-terminal domain-containing protein [Conexibacter stalactiti]MEC5037770.1 glycoside hydrolase family 3 C-terminal domain-containing protein [Conexibacter stalactiti]
MSGTSLRSRAALAGALSVAVIFVGAPSAALAQAPPWDADPAVEQRVEQLLDQLTTEEKADLATGELNNFFGFYNNPIERVGIPAQPMADGPIGVRVANPEIDRRTTRFPSGTAMGATWNPALVEQVGAAIGDEAFHTGHNTQLGPSVDIPRSPLWGRAFEGYGEDPLLSGTIASGYINGIQSNPVMATIKHFVGYVQETDRFTYDARVDDRTLHEIYAKPYELAIQNSHPGAAMCAFNRINGVYACENPLMNTLLKGDYGFRGFVMSDYNATPSTARAANNGLDQEQPGDQGPDSANFGARLVAAVAAGDVSEGRLDDMARRILRPMVGLGLFETLPRADRAFDADAHSALARQVAQEGSVLLKNERRVLPLRPGGRLRSLAVIGPDADNASAQGGGSAVIPFATREISPLAGIRARAGDNVRVTYAAGTDGVNEGDLLGGPVPVPSTLLRPAGGGAADRGLHARYWTNTTFDGAPKVDQTDPEVNVNFGFQNWFSAASPKATQSATVAAFAARGDFSLTGSISARWEGNLIAPATAEYTLGLTARGDATLRIDGEVFATTSGDRVVTVGRAIRLVGGEPHTIRIDYSAAALNGYQGGQVRFFWQHPEDVLSPAMRDAVADARAADAAVVVVRDYETEGAAREADRPTLDLPKEQDLLIRAVGRANPNTVVVVETGAPSKTSTWEDSVGAILHAWYPGQEQGGAIADLLFGDVNPSGKLPATVPADEGQVPGIEVDDVVDFDEGVFVGYRGFGQRGLTPSYPFGHGLSYSRFAYRRLQLRGGTGDATATFTLRNASNRAGSEVAQVYIGRLPTRFVATPPRQLAGFVRVPLAARQRERVTVTIPRRSLSYWDSGSQHWVTPAGRVQVYVGSSSEDVRLAGVVNVR